MNFVKIDLISNLDIFFFLTTKSITIKWVKYLIVLSIIVFIVYLNHLDGLVKAKFSMPINNSALQLDDYPNALTNMLLLMEDQSFFEHPGVDFKEIIIVVRDYLFYNKPMRGASTLTQQLIKNSILTKERTVKRKLNEVIMALLLEYSSDKTFILNRYMNTVYLGQQGNKPIHGFDHAAQFYFHKPIGALSLEEMATLVALVKGPSFYHPIKYAQRLANRRQLVLSLYYKYKKIIK